MTSEEYGQYIDDFELDVDVMPGESLTEYIERRRREFESKADGGSIGIEVLFKEKMANGGRVPAVSGGFLKLLAEGAERGKQGIMELIETGKGKIADFAEAQANKKMFRSVDDIPPTSISQATGPMTIEMMEAVDPSIIKKVLRTQELGLYEETPEILKAANLLERFTKKVKGKRVIDYERAEAILGVPLRGDETINDLFKIEFETRPVEKMADGGRVGLFMGGDPLTGQALQIYNSMKNYNFTDQEIADALSARGLNNVALTTTNPVTNTATNIINQGGGDGGGGGDIKTFDKGFSSQNFGLGANKDVVDYEAEAYGIGPTFKGQIARAFSAFSNIPTPFNIARMGIQKAVDFAKQKAAEKKAAEEAAAKARKAEIQNIQTRLDRDPRGYDGSRGPNANPYGGGGGGLHSDYADGGLATMFTRRR